MLTSEQRTALASLRAIWPEQRFVLIGAGALRMHNKLQRFTEDLDLAIAVDEPDYPGPLAQDVAWTHDIAMSQRWVHESGAELDILPAGASLCAQGHLTWPDGHRMSLEGFTALFAAPLELVDSVLRIEVASVPLIVMLKMVAWLDRPAERARDLDDIAFLLIQYLDERDDDDFDRLVEAYQQGYTAPHTATAFLLGRDVANCDGSAPIARRFIDSLSKTHSWMLEQMRAKGPAALSRDEDFEAIWSAFVQGLQC